MKKETYFRTNNNKCKRIECSYDYQALPPRCPHPTLGCLEEAFIPTTLAIGMTASLVRSPVSIPKVIAAVNTIGCGRYLRISSFLATTISTWWRLLHKGGSTSRTFYTKQEFSGYAPTISLDSE